MNKNTLVKFNDALHRLSVFLLSYAVESNNPSKTVRRMFSSRKNS